MKIFERKVDTSIIDLSEKDKSTIDKSEKDIGKIDRSREVCGLWKYLKERVRFQVLL